MYVIGNAEEAEALAGACLKNVKEIYAETKQLQSELSKLRESFQDNGVQEVEDVVANVYREIEKHLDDVAEVRNVLQQYAEVLRRD